MQYGLGQCQGTPVVEYGLKPVLEQRQDLPQLPEE